MEKEIFDAMAGLGGFFEVENNQRDGKSTRFLADREECLQSLKDLLNFLKVDDQLLVRLKLGRYKVLPQKLVPMFKSYRDDRQWVALIFKVMLWLTEPVSQETPDLWMHMEHLQDAKEAFLDRDSFLILLQFLVDLLEESDSAEREEEPTEQKTADKKGVTLELVITLLSRLLMIPDPVAGHPGFVPQRKSMQLQYIKLFHDESLFIALMYFLEKLNVEKNCGQAWAFLEIFYHVCTKVDPERASRLKQSVSQTSKEKDILSEMMLKDTLVRKARTPQQSRHGRFGTLMEVRNTHLAEEGKPVVHLSHNVEDVSRTEYAKKGYRGGNSRSETKQNIFLDPTFIDLEEGSCREHDRVNPYVSSGRELPVVLSDAVFAGLRDFFCDFLGISGNQAHVGVSQFSQLVIFLRNHLKENAFAARKQPGVEADKQEAKAQKRHDEPRLLSFVAWVLEFHRHHYAAKVSEAKSKNQEQPPIDIVAIQGAIDLDMIQFVIKLLGDHGKRSGLNPSKLVITLRTLTQQIKTIGVVLESNEERVKDIAEVLLANILKDDVLGHLAWIMKNFKPMSHDPRVLTYSLEAFHCITRLVEKSGTKDFEVESGFRGGIKASSLEQQVERLCNCAVIENLFSLMEKYSDLSAGLLNMLVRLLYRIIKIQHTNIVVFFEIMYFVRIERMLDDPMVTDKRLGKRYTEMVELLKFILRQFFKCAEKNKCVFIELMFRKIPETRADSLLGAFGQEFAAILDNYEQESYKEVLDKMRSGETVSALKLKQQQMLSGEGPPWTAEEDSTLMDKYDMYQNHPLCCDLLAAELPVENHRTAKAIRKRLIELGITGPNKQPRMMDDSKDGTKKRKAAELEDDKAKTKHARVDEADEIDSDLGDELELDLERMIDAAMADTQVDTMLDETQGGSAQRAQNDDSQVLEDELERIIDEGIEDDSLPTLEVADCAVNVTATTLPAASMTASTAVDATATSATIPPATGDTEELELDLERIMDEGLDDDIKDLMKVDPIVPASAATTVASTASTIPESTAPTMIDSNTLDCAAGARPCAAADAASESRAATIAATCTTSPTVPESVPSTVIEPTVQTIQGAPAATAPESTAAGSTDKTVKMTTSVSSENRLSKAPTTIPTPARTSATATALPSLDVEMDELEKNLEDLIDNMSPTKADVSTATTPAQASRDIRDKTPTPTNSSKRGMSFGSQLSQESIGLECQLEKLIDEDLQPSCPDPVLSQGDTPRHLKGNMPTQDTADLENELENMLDHLDDDMD